MENDLDQETFRSRGPVVRRLLVVSLIVLFAIQMLAITIGHLTNSEDFYLMDSVSEGLAADYALTKAMASISSMSPSRASARTSTVVSAGYGGVKKRSRNSTMR